MSVLSYLFYSLSLKLPNKGMSFSFIPLKFPNNEMEEYSKIILFIHFHSILSSQMRPKWRENEMCRKEYSITHSSLVNQNFKFSFPPKLGKI